MGLWGWGHPSPSPCPAQLPPQTPTLRLPAASIYFESNPCPLPPPPLLSPSLAPLFLMPSATLLASGGSATNDHQPCSSPSQPKQDIKLSISLHYNLLPYFIQVSSFIYCLSVFPPEDFRVVLVSRPIFAGFRRAFPMLLASFIIFSSSIGARSCSPAFQTQPLEEKPPV